MGGAEAGWAKKTEVARAADALDAAVTPQQREATDISRAPAAASERLDGASVEPASCCGDSTVAVAAVTQTSMPAPVNGPGRAPAQPSIRDGPINALTDADARTASPIGAPVVTAKPPSDSRTDGEAPPLRPPRPTTSTTEFVRGAMAGQDFWVRHTGQTPDQTPDVSPCGFRVGTARSQDSVESIDSASCDSSVLSTARGATIDAVVQAREMRRYAQEWAEHLDAQPRMQTINEKSPSPSSNQKVTLSTAEREIAGTQCRVSDVVQQMDSSFKGVAGTDAATTTDGAGAAVTVSSSSPTDDTTKMLTPAVVDDLPTAAAVAIAVPSRMAAIRSLSGVSSPTSQASSQASTARRRRISSSMSPPRTPKASERGSGSAREGTPSAGAPAPTPAPRSARNSARNSGRGRAKDGEAVKV